MPRQKWLMFGLDLDVPKTYKKTSVEPRLTCFMHKTAWENAYFSKNGKRFRTDKTGHFVKAVVSQYGQNDLFLGWI